MTPGFVAAVLEGFEGTLDVVIERLGAGDLRSDVEELQAHIARTRQQFEAADTSAPVAAAS
jgi:hypothetical protein